MTDIATVWNPGLGRGDWVIAAPDLQSGNDLTTAVLISLFTDRTADPDDKIPDGTTDPRGWWGDLGKTVPIGSKIWLYMRSKLTDQLAALVQDAGQQALQWLVDDGVAAKVRVVTEIQPPNRLALGARIYQPDGSSATFGFAWAWAQFGAGQPFVAPPPSLFTLGDSILGGGDVL